MKNTILTISVIFIFSLTTSCQTEVPKKVSSAFNEKFSTMENVTWEQESENEWEASFISEGKETSAVFDADGIWLETETEVVLEDIPAEVFKTLCLKYEEFEIEEAESIESPDFNGYEIEIEMEDDDDEKEFEVLIDSDGTFVKAVEEDDDEGEDEDDDDDDNDDDDGEEDDD